MLTLLVYTPDLSIPPFQGQLMNFLLLQIVIRVLKIECGRELRIFSAYYSQDGRSINGVYNVALLHQAYRLER